MVLIMRDTFFGLLCTGFIACLLLAATTGPAFAYIDPGSGSMILQGIVATLAIGLATIKIYWQKLKSIFSKKPPETTTSREDSEDT